MTRYETISCFTDLGRSDETVGVLHSLLRELSPGSVVVDVCHTLARGDARAAALMVARSVPYLAPGLVLVSVGDVLERPAVAVEVGDGQAVLIGPDNGALGAAVALVGGADRAVALTKEEWHLESPGRLHPARDILTPVAGRVAAGLSLEEVGELVDPAGLLPALIPVPRIEDDGSLSAEVLHVHRDGSSQLNIDRDAIEGMGDVLVVEFGEQRRVVKVGPSGQPPSGQPSMVDDVFGLLALADLTDAPTQDLGVGTEVVIREAR